MAAPSPLIQALMGTDGLIAPQKPKDLFTSMLIKNGLDSSPVGHWTQGASRIVQALLGADALRGQEADESQRRAAPDEIASIHSGGQPAPAQAMPPPPEPRPQQRMPSVAPTGFAPSAPPMAGAPSEVPPQASFAGRFNAIGDDPRRPDPMGIPQSQVARVNGQQPPAAPSVPPITWGDGVQGNDPSKLPPPGQPVRQPTQVAQSAQPPGGLDMRAIDAMRKSKNPYVKAIGTQKFMEEILRSPEYEIKTDGSVTVAVDKRNPRNRHVIDDPALAQTLMDRKVKEAAAVKAAEVRATGQGEAQSSLESIRSKMPGLESVVKELDGLAEKATYTLAGQGRDALRRQMGAEPTEGSVARVRYMSMVDNQILPLLRDTFGAQFTQKEGEALRATLGNPDLGPKEKQQVLKSFIEQKRRDVEALESRTGTAPVQGGGQQRGAPQESRSVGGKTYVKINGQWFEQ
jgi:hypothetical protein